MLHHENAGGSVMRSSDYPVLMTATIRQGAVAKVAPFA